MSKIRLTGGEPSLRKDLDEIIATVAAVPGIRKVAITTNGTLLPRRLPGWHRAGLTALNVSMDSLQRERFHTITGHDRLPEIQQGLALAQALGLPAIKLNAVLLRGLNDDELPQWMDYLRDRHFQRALHRTDAHRRQRSLFPAPPPARRRGDRAAAGRGLARAAARADGPAREFGHPNHRGSIGIIAPYS